MEHIGTDHATGAELFWRRVDLSEVESDCSALEPLFGGVTDKAGLLGPADEVAAFLDGQRVCLVWTVARKPTKDYFLVARASTSAIERGLARLAIGTALVLGSSPTGREKHSPGFNVHAVLNSGRPCAHDLVDRLGLSLTGDGEPPRQACVGDGLSCQRRAFAYFALRCTDEAVATAASSSSP